MTNATPSVDRIVVYGAGALGSVLGGRLSREVPVLLVAREAHIEAMRANGLKLEGLSDRTVPLGERLQAVTHLDPEVAPLRSGDAVFLTVKAMQVAELGGELSDNAPEGGRLPLLTFQNGTGFERDVEHAAGGRFDVLHCVSHAGATFVEPGRVEDWGGELLLPDAPPCPRVAELLRAADFKARCLPDLEVWRWKKIAFNCALNALSALLEVRNRETITPEWRPFRRAVLSEARAAAAAEGVALPPAEELLVEFEGRARASNNVNSMWQDVQRGKRTEIGYLNGAVARIAAEHGGAAPVNAALAKWIPRIGAAANAEQARALREGALSELRDLAKSE